jgi:hypothetical protein
MTDTPAIGSPTGSRHALSRPLTDNHRTGRRRIHGISAGFVVLQHISAIRRPSTPQSSYPVADNVKTILTQRSVFHPIRSTRRRLHRLSPTAATRVRTQLKP